MRLVPKYETLTSEVNISNYGFADDKTRSVLKDLVQLMEDSGYSTEEIETEMHYADVESALRNAGY
jgi:hypothetical protein